MASTRLLSAYEKGISRIVVLAAGIAEIAHAARRVEAVAVLLVDRVALDPEPLTDSLRARAPRRNRQQAGHDQHSGDQSVRVLCGQIIAQNPDGA